MSRIKVIFAVLMLAAMVGIVPQVQAQTLEVVIAGSSAMWQTMALGAYNDNTAAAAPAGITPPLGHYTSGSNFNLVDNRSTVPTVDNGATWIVWDSSVPPKVWAYIKVDSVVGNRCYFAAPKCTVVTNGAFPAAGNQISNTLWGDGSNDQLPPAAVQTIFTTGTAVTVAATDIRPEDAAFAACRVNSAQGGSVAAGANTDNLDGLGYNANNPSGQCPVYAAATAQAKGVGNAIVSGYPGHAATDVANVLAFNLTGKDPITNTTLPAAYTTTNVGAAPIIFIINRQNNLKTLTTATEQQLQQVFSGTLCDGSAFGAAFAGPINIFLREPLSGTYNTTEATVMRYPTLYAEGTLPGSNPEGLSMETNVNVLANGFSLANQAGTCHSPSGLGARYRAIGTGEEVKSVLNSAIAAFTTKQDGIGFTFFSYGNVSSIADSPNYGYIKLNGVDPIWASYGPGKTPLSIDPGMATGAGELPAAADLPVATCPGPAFPCSEHNIWGNGFSYPNLRNGTYRSWSLLRLVSTGTPSTNAVDLVKASNKYVVNTVPDYVPATAVTGTTDLGLKLLRSHYQQRDGNNVKLGKAPTNVPEAGGDMGGMIVPTTAGVTTEKQIQIVQSSNADGDLSPALRPE